MICPVSGLNSADLIHPSVLLRQACEAAKIRRLREDGGGFAGIGQGQGQRSCAGVAVSSTASGQAGALQLVSVPAADLG